MSDITYAVYIYINTSDSVSLRSDYPSSDRIMGRETNFVRITNKYVIINRPCANSIEGLLWHSLPNLVS